MKSSKKACNKIEQNISNLSSGDPLVDVDGSVVKIYKNSDDTIKYLMIMRLMLFG